MESKDSKINFPNEEEDVVEPRVPRVGISHRERGHDISTSLADSDTIAVEAVHVPSGSTLRITYGNAKVIGTGSFGVVHVATLKEFGTDKEVAIKKVLQDERYKNRELQILKDLRHANIVALFYYFFSVSSTKPNETYLNLVQEFIPQTLSRLIKHYWRIRQIIPLAYVKLYSFQLLRGLAYIHHENVCHRDIKPQNLLIDPEQGILKICDFGSAKVLNPLEPNVSYICSRYYRAPELIFGATHYTCRIDMWSAGCVIGELLLGRPLFPGGSGVDQLVEIIKVLGTPTPEQVLEMNPQYTEFKFRNISGCPWEKVMRHRINDSAFSVIRRLLVYSPRTRACSSEILSDSFFSDLIFPPPGHPPNATGHLPSGKPAPQFPTAFTESELGYLPAELVIRIRACRDAVAEAAIRAQYTSESTSDVNNEQSALSTDGSSRRRASESLNDSSSSFRPLSGQFSMNPSSITKSGRIGNSRTRNPMVASVSDVRASSKPSVRPRDLHDVDHSNFSGPTYDRSVSHRLSQSVHQDPETNGSSRRLSRARTGTLNRNGHSKPVSKSTHE